MLQWLQRYMPRNIGPIQMLGSTFVLRTFKRKDASSLATFLARNKKAWSQFEPVHAASFYTERAQRRQIKVWQQQMQRGREYSFGIYVDDTLVGHIVLYAIKGMPYKSGFVGYSMDSGYYKRGIMTEALTLMQRFAFERLHLQRVEAYVSPDNIPSLRVLEKTLFRREGLLRQLLWLNGRWQDHYLYASIADEYYKSKK